MRGEPFVNWEGLGDSKDGYLGLKLGDESSLITKGTTPTSIGQSFKPVGIRFVKIESIDDRGGFLLDKMDYIDEVTNNLLGRSELQENDILISIAGALGRVALVTKNILPANTNQALAIIRLKSDSILNHRYLFYYLNCYSIKGHIRAINVRGAQANLSLQNIRDFYITAPTVREQAAIATVLSDVDGLIDWLTQLIGKKKNILRGAMQELLTGRKRLEGFSGDWVKTTLSNVIRLQGGYSFQSERFVRHGIPVIRISNLINGGVSLKNAVCHRQLNMTDQFVVKKGDILLAMSGATTGKIAVYSHKEYAYLNQRVGKFETVDVGYLVMDYLKFLLMSSLFVTQLMDILAAGAQPNINPKDVGKMIFAIPPTIKEQTAIANILSDMDAEIEALEQKRAKYEALKQGMMQELLTGRIRLEGAAQCRAWVKGSA